MLTEIMAYAELRDVAPGEDRIEFVRLMRVMDEAYLTHFNAKNAVSNG